MNKTLFIVSELFHLWNQNVANVCVFDKLLYNKLNERGDLNGKHTTVLPFIDDSKEDLQACSDFVEKKYEKFILILTKKLNLAHGENQSVEYWRKCLGIGFIRYITLAHQVYETCNVNINNDDYKLFVLKEKDFKIPNDFDESRKIFQHTDLGTEQLFSVYCRLYYKGELIEKRVTEKVKNIKTIKSKNVFNKKIRVLFSKDGIKKIIFKALLMFQVESNITAGSLGAYFSVGNNLSLFLKSKGKYGFLYNEPKGSNDSGFYDKDGRALISSLDDKSDRFDAYLCACLKHDFPKLYLENYKKHCLSVDEYISRYKNIKYVISEAWIGSSSMSFILARMALKNIKHIYNEHNYISFPFIGEEINFSAKNSDVFISMGWDNKKIENLKKGSSLFDFYIPRAINKSIDILYVASLPVYKKPQYTATYGESGNNAIKYMEYMSELFDLIPDSLKRKVVYRDYPREKVTDWNIPDLNNELKCHLKSCGIDNHHYSSKKMMSKSRLVLVDYISTAYIEALVSNIPVIILFDKSRYYLLDEYENFFSELIEVGVVQLEPKSAAEFIIKIESAPQVWWFKEEVQKARLCFLDKFMGDRSKMINMLVGYACKNE